MNDTTRRAIACLDKVKSILIEKEKGYGDASDRVAIFSRVAPSEILRTRIDQKLARIRSLGTSSQGEDTHLDLIGYLALLYAVELREDNDEST